MFVTEYMQYFLSELFLLWSNIFQLFTSECFSNLCHVLFVVNLIYGFVCCESNIYIEICMNIKQQYNTVQYTHTHTHTHARAHTHTHTHTHMCVHAHTFWGRWDGVKARLWPQLPVYCGQCYQWNHYVVFIVETTFHCLWWVNLLNTCICICDCL
jgi:hypothetical protein